MAQTPNTDTDPRTFALTDRVLPWFTAKMADLGKRADKLGVPAPTWTTLDTETVEHPDGTITTYTTVTVTGDAPCYDGWTMAAVIDLDPEDGDEHIVNAIGGRDIDPTWRTETDRCDHCGPTTARGRRKLVVVEHEDGDRRTIGTTCLRDFLGHNSPERIAGWAEMLACLEDEIGEAIDQDERGPREEYRYSPRFYLGWVLRSITEEGWLSKGRCGFDDVPTCDRALHLMFPDKATPSWNLPAPLTTEELAEAERAIEWATTQGGNDYLDNLRVVAGKDGWRHKDIGLGASIASAYRREMDRLVEAKRRADLTADSTFIGEIGQRLVITGDVIMAREFDGDYGIKTLVKVLTDDGNLVTWWCSGIAPERADRITGKATVKDHEVYNAEKQTVVNRWSWELVEDTDDAPAEEMVAATTPGPSSQASLF